MQRFQSFLRGEWTELFVTELMQGGRTHPHTETPAGKAPNIIEAVCGNLTKAMAQMTSFGVASMTEATVDTITWMLTPHGDQLPKGFDRLTQGAGMILTLREVTHHLRMMERRKAKAGWALGHLCEAFRHPDRELTNFWKLFISGNLCDATHRVFMVQTVTPLNKGTTGNLRPLGCAATFRRIAFGALVRAEATNLAKVLGPASTPWDGKQHWNHYRERPRRR